MSNHFIKATIIRAIRSFCEALVSTIPAGFVITPVMIQTLDWNMVYIILAWLGTALLHTLLVVLAAIATGLPEADYEEYLHMDVDEPDDADAEVFDDEE